MKYRICPIPAIGCVRYRVFGIVRAGPVSDLKTGSGEGGYAKGSHRRRQSREELTAMPASQSLPMPPWSSEPSMSLPCPLRGLQVQSCVGRRSGIVRRCLPSHSPRHGRALASSLSPLSSSRRPRSDSHISMLSRRAGGFISWRARGDSKHREVAGVVDTFGVNGLGRG